MAKIDKDLIEDIRDRLDRPIVLVGMMGAGKTRIGKQVASALGLSFSDSDDEIEKAAGMSISEIFERFGESYFRDGERRVLGRLLAEGSGVIATGGGAVMNEETAATIWHSTLSVWVKADIEVMVERTARKGNRPLLKTGDPRQILEDLAAVRYPVYQKADIVIDSRDSTADTVIAELVDKIHDRLFHPQRQAM